MTVSDSRSAVALAKEIPALLEAGIMVEAGGHGLLTFRRQDLIVVSPGVPMDTPEVKQVVAFGLPVIGELELASRFLQGQVVAITGSNGKTTTTTLVGKIFADAGVPTLVGGNIGLPVIELVAREYGRRRWSVLEVSSFQLETMEEFQPRIAVVLNITPDHLDRHGSFESYAAAKARITERQTAEDFLVLNAEDKPTQMVAAKTKAQIFWFSGRRPIKQGAFVHGESILFVPREGAKAEPVMPVAEIPLKGAHNVENVLAAVCAARLAGIPAEVIRAAVAGVQGGGASAGVCGGGGWRGVLQRLEGDECGCDDEGGGVVCGRDSPDPGRQGQGLGLHADGGAAAGAGEGCLHHWFGGGKD